MQLRSSSDLRRCFLAFIHGWRYCRSTPWGFNSLPEFTNSPIEAISNTCAPERASERQERRLGVGGQFAGFLGRDGPAGEHTEAVGRRCPGGRGVGQHRQSGMGGEFHHLEVEVEGAGTGCTRRLRPVRWKRTSWAAQRQRNSSLCVDSSPIRLMSSTSDHPTWRACLPVQNTIARLYLAHEVITPCQVHEHRACSIPAR